jgi:hypothetical protein
MVSAALATESLEKGQELLLLMNEVNLFFLISLKVVTTVINKKKPLLLVSEH